MTTLGTARAVIADESAEPHDVIAAVAGLSETARRRLWGELDFVKRRIDARGDSVDRAVYTPREIALVFSLAPARDLDEVASAGQLLDEFVSVAVDAAVARDDEWLTAYIGLVHDGWNVLRTSFNLLVLRLLRRRGVLLPAHPEHLHWCLMWAYPPGRNPHGRFVDDRTDAEYAVEAAMFRERELWLFFETEGAGSWDVHIVGLLEFLDVDAPMRARLLDASLQGLLRDFSAYNIKFALTVHRTLAPDLDEIRARESLYVSVLTTAPLAAVTLAQEHLARLIDAPEPGHGVDGAVTVDVPALLEASAVVLARRDKKSVLAQLRLLDRLARRHPDQATPIADAIEAVLDDDRGDLVERARRILAAIAPDRATEAAAAPAGRGSSTVDVPGPRRAPIPRPAEVVEPVADADGLARIFTRLLEDPRPATDLVRAVDGVRRLRGHRPAAAEALVRRATLILQDMGGPSTAEPRPFVAELVLAWLGERALQRWSNTPTEAPYYPGTEYHLSLERGVRMPPGFVIRRVTSTADRTGPIDAQWFADSFKEVGIHELDKTRSVTATVASAYPLRLFALWLVEAAERARRSDPEASPAVIDGYVHAVHATAPSAQWRRSTEVPVYPPWMSTMYRTSKPTLHWIDEAAEPGSPADLSDIVLEHWQRIQDARWVPRFAAVVDWWSWLYAGSPDHLAAQSHPFLLQAVESINVSATAPVVDALGASLVPLGPPSYSALALALSEKGADGRARAAEAVAVLAASGLLDAGALAEQLTLCLVEGQGQTARVASALTDAARISAIAGWRVLETLQALLPITTTVHAGAKLVEATAVLAPRYGVVPTLPEALAARATGSSAMAVAVRALRACVAHETDLALEAAEQARRALG